MAKINRQKQKECVSFSPKNNQQQPKQTKITPQGIKFNQKVKHNEATNKSTMKAADRQHCDTLLQSLPVSATA